MRSSFIKKVIGKKVKEAKILSKREVLSFQQKVYDYYHVYGRKDLPWRNTDNCYHILVSEIMLQQTQVVRVLPKYETFLDCFPTIVTLAEAPLKKVLRAWVGLGYNRRARALKVTAEMIVREYGSQLPDNYKTLQTLPGIGAATAGELLAFCHNKGVPFLETNIQTVYIHEFYKDWEQVCNKELFPLVEQTLDQENPRQWYYALMDYGVMLKKEHGNLSRKSRQYQKQSRFQGSDRQIRGKIIKTLTEHDCTFKQLQGIIDVSPEKLERVLKTLIKDTMVKRNGNTFSIAS